MTDFIFRSYMAILLLSYFSSLIRFKRLSRADALISLLLLLTISNELVCRYLSFRYRNDMIAWHVYSPLEFLLICCYFNDTIEGFERMGAGLWIGAAGLFFSLVNTLCFQPVWTLNSNFLLLESILIFTLSLVSSYQMLKDDAVIVRSSARFRVTASFMGWSAFSVVQWGAYEWLRVEICSYQPTLWLLWFFNVSFYLSLLMLFFSYPKMTPSGE